MANIIITLLSNKRSRQTVEGQDAIVATQAGGYSVIESENNSTTFEVRFPAEYYGQGGAVYMKNAKGEYGTIGLGVIGASHSFKLPDTMTVAGNTFLVFQATDSSADAELGSPPKTVWAPIVVPVMATSVDYTKVAMASPDVLAEAIAVAADAKAGKFNGKDCHIRFAEDANGTNMAESWSPSLTWVGFYISHEPSADPEDYEWSLFVGECVPEEDTTTTAVEYELVSNTDKTFKAAGITSLKFIVPANVKHGFYCGVNVQTGDADCTVQAATNNSQYPLKYMERGYETTHFTKLAKNSVTLMSFFCDGINLYCYITEAET